MLLFYYAHRGLVNHELQKYEDALRDINKAIELDPDYAFLLHLSWSSQS